MAPHLMLQQAMGSTIVGRAMHISTPASQRIGLAQASQQCASAMAEVANVQRQAHVDSTVKARQRIAAQFQLFLSKQPPGLGANLLTAGPEHVLWFFQQEYTKQNTGEQLLHLQESVTAVGELLHSYCTECSTQSSPSLSQRR